MIVETITFMTKRNKAVNAFEVGIIKNETEGRCNDKWPMYRIELTCRQNGQFHNIQSTTWQKDLSSCFSQCAKSHLKGPLTDDIDVAVGPFTCRVSARGDIAVSGELVVKGSDDAFFTMPETIVGIIKGKMTGSEFEKDLSDAIAAKFSIQAWGDLVLGQEWELECHPTERMVNAFWELFQAERG